MGSIASFGTGEKQHVEDVHLVQTELLVFNNLPTIHSIDCSVSVPTPSTE